METRLKLNPMELEPIRKKTFKRSTRPTLLNCRLVCKLWKQEVDELGRDLRPVKRQVFETPQTLTCITQYMDITDRVSLSLSCKVLYGRMSDFGSLSKDMEKYKEKRTEIRESSKEKFKYYYRTINLIKYGASALFGTIGFGSAGMMFNIPTILYEIATLEAKHIDGADYSRISQFLKENGEDGLKEIIEYFSKESILPSPMRNQAIEEATAIFGKHIADVSKYNKKSMMVQFANENTNRITKMIFENRGKIFLTTAIIGGIILAVKNKSTAKEVFLPDWDEIGSDFKKTATIKIPDELLKRYGIPKELIPPFPVYCNCTFIDEKVEMKFFTNEEEEIKCTQGGHLIGLKESKQDLKNKVCSSTGAEVSEKSYIPLITILINLQREETKKKILS